MQAKVDVVLRDFNHIQKINFLYISAEFLSEIYQL